MGERFKGRTVVITGAASGMGRDASLRFAAEGAQLVAVDINEEATASLVAEIEAAGGGAQAIAADLTNLDSISTLVATVKRDHGKIDALWNHVGMPGPRGFDFDADAWDLNAALNLRAPVFLSKEAWPLLQQATNGASILFTASVSALIASRNSPVYSALKAGVVGYARALAAVGGADGIRSNAICPGVVETPMLRGFFGEEGDSDAIVAERLEAYFAAVPMGRACKPEEVTDLALFLASDDASFITGATIPIDGGYVAI